MSRRRLRLVPALAARRPEILSGSGSHPRSDSSAEFDLRLRTTRRSQFPRASRRRRTPRPWVNRVEKLKPLDPFAGRQGDPRAQTRPHDFEERPFVWIIARPPTGRGHKHDRSVIASGQFDEAVEDVLGNSSTTMQHNRTWTLGILWMLAIPKRCRRPLPSDRDLRRKSQAQFIVAQWKFA